MSRFYGSVVGCAPTPGTRRGTKASGITSHTRGWDLGVKVVGAEDPKTGEDVFYVYATGGSNGHEADVLVGVLTEAEWRFKQARKL